MFLYHRTQPERFASIMQHGLVPGGPVAGKTPPELLARILKIYSGTMPIFLSESPDEYKNGIVLKIDVSKLRLLPDIPGIVERGGELRDKGVWFDPDLTPEELWTIPFDENGVISYKRLLTNKKDAVTFMRFTRTAATFDRVDPSKIERISP